MVVLLENWEGKLVKVGQEKYEELMRKYVKHLRRNWYEVKGKVKILSDNEVGIYSYDGFLICILTCYDNIMEKFKKVEGKLIKSIPVYLSVDFTDREIFIPHVR